MKPLLKAVVTLTLCFIALQFFQDNFVLDREKIQLGQWYRVFTGNFVHSNFPHLALNLASLWLACFLFIDSMKLKLFVTSILLLSALVGLGIYFFNLDIFKYYGFSGVLYGLYLVGATTIILQKDYVTAGLLYVFIIGKMLWGIFMGGDASSAELIGMPVAVHSHLYGAVGGVVISLYLLVTRYNKQTKT